MPLAAHATFSGDVLQLEAAWGDPDGVAALVQVSGQAAVASLEAAVQLGERVAQALQAAVAAQGKAAH
jgi:hydroxymethylbilane synthase